MQVYCIYENISMRFQKTVQPILFWSFIERLFQVPFGVVNFTTCIQSPYAVEDIEITKQFAMTDVFLSLNLPIARILGVENARAWVSMVFT